MILIGRRKISNWCHDQIKILLSFLFFFSFRSTNFQDRKLFSLPQVVLMMSFSRRKV
eukprot:UN20266